MTSKKIKIAHISDVHFKDGRRIEYSVILERLYERLRVENPDVIVVTGDIFHDKTKASANNFSDVDLFLTSLTLISPTILIPGNHDLNVKVPGSPDLITPVINNHITLREPFFNYWRNSGVYFAHGIVWVVIAPDQAIPSQEEIENFVSLRNLEKTPRICLVHEAVDGSLLYNGNSLRGRRVSPSDLVDYDAVLAGDIHLRQFIGNNKRAMYAGSLIQQNIGEDFRNHGFLIWELELSDNPYSYRTKLPIIHHINLINDFGYFKFQIRNGVDVSGIDFPKNPNYYEIIYDENTSIEELNFHIEKYVSLYGFRPRSIVLSRGDENIKKVDASSEVLSDLQKEAYSLKFHEKIIIDILGEDYPLLKEVIGLHRESYLESLSSKKGRSRVRLLTLKFSNLYCYGENNIIDFTKLENKISGVIAPNRSGKSSLIDVIIFALYDEYPRADKKMSIINESSSDYYLFLEFELDGKKGYIEKKGRRGKASYSADYNFVYNNENLTKGTNTLTSQEIESFIGSFYNSQLTSIFQQGNQNDFILLKPSERKRALAQLLLLGSFEELEKSVKEKSSSLNFEIKVLEKTFRGFSSAELIEKISLASNEQNYVKIIHEEIIKKINFLLENSKSVNSEIEKVNFDIQVCQNNLENLLGSGEIIDFETSYSQLKKVIEEIGENEGFSPIEELSFYDNYQIDNSNSCCPIIKRKELDILINNIKLTKEENVRKELELLEKLRNIDLKRASSIVLFDASIERISKEFPNLKVNFEKFSIEENFDSYNIGIEKPWATFKKGRRVSYQEIIDAKKILSEFESEQETAKKKIFQKLGSLSETAVPKIDDHLELSYFSLSSSFNSDFEKVNQRESLLKEEEFNNECIKSLEAQITKFGNDVLEEAKKIVELDSYSSNDDNIIYNLENQLNSLNAQQFIFKSLTFNKECSDCNLNYKNLNVYEGEVPLEKRIREVSINIAVLNIHRLKNIERENDFIRLRLEEANNAQIRVNKFNVISAQKKDFVDYQIKLKEINEWKKKEKALEVLEIATYWWIEDNNTYEMHKIVSHQLEDLRRLNEEISELSIQAKKVSCLISNLNSDNDKLSYVINEKVSARIFWLKKVVFAIEKVEKAQEQKKIIEKVAQVEEVINESQKKLQSLRNQRNAFEKELNELYSKKDEIIGKLSSLKHKISQFNDDLIYEKNRKSKFIDLGKKLDTVNAYRRIIDPKTGIADILLKKARGYLEDQVNQILSECNSLFSVRINDDFELDVDFGSGKERKIISAKLASGYQRFILSIAFQNALWSLSDVTLLNCRFIDEGFGSCDDENLESIINYFNSNAFSSKSPLINFIVSHVDAMKSAIQIPLFITNDNLERSKISN